MNILFVNYGDFTSNSLNHIAGFAQALSAAGHACAVAVPEGKDTLGVIPHPRFIAVSYDEALADPRLFPDGRPADIVHAWTPREVVRKFVLNYQRQARARLIVHLEDNEESLLATWLGRPLDQLRAVSEEELAEKNAPALVNPRRYRHLLRAAEGVTVIVDPLRQFVPAGVPCLLLRPGIDFAHSPQMPPDAGLRRELGLGEEKIIVFTGSSTFANEEEIRELYEAVALLNQRGISTRLVRTGINSPAFQASLPAKTKAFVLDLGFVDKAKLPRLLALADVLVQPGRRGAFNDFRLPSKLPEFLSAGKPVILPAANLGLELRDGVDALILKNGDPGEMADACGRVFGDARLAETLGRNAAAFARRHFDLGANTQGLIGFYAQASAGPIRPGSTATLTGGETELSLSLQTLAAEARDPDAAAMATDLAASVAALERHDSFQGERRRLESERDDWRQRHRLTEQHGANLANQLKSADRLTRIVNQRARMVSRQILQLRGQIQRLNEQLQDRDKAVDAQRMEIGRLEARCDYLAGTIADRQKKIRTMQESFSWRATQPLRYLRRKLLDPREADCRAARDRPCVRIGADAGGQPDLFASSGSTSVLGPAAAKDLCRRMVLLR